MRLFSEFLKNEFQTRVKESEKQEFNDHYNQMFSQESPYDAFQWRNGYGWWNEEDMFGCDDIFMRNSRSRSSSRDTRSPLRPTNSTKTIDQDQDLDQDLEIVIPEIIDLDHNLGTETAEIIDLGHDLEVAKPSKNPKKKSNK